ncbi:hypothetical protein F511_33526 [Dorcoceras hygrometricum]|uniref:Uncharacterized protein n=1 Tax=Dorcoceras hygrometricum TaxID=472368 RepID=A0A2Z7B5J5_9LAMI|nr:hypothetical protein F511_33526 [Dorcoceras hygrometricum]
MQNQIPSKHEDVKLCVCSLSHIGIKQHSALAFILHARIRLHTQSVSGALFYVQEPERAGKDELPDSSWRAIENISDVS